jgi:tetratricopeptide (TPR) repeat protein
MAEAHACIGYTMHRLGDDQGAVESLQAALQFDPEHAEARIYLANVLYDRGEYEPALYHFEQTRPEDHWDELGLWRVIELKQAAYKLGDEDPELKPWRDRVDELTDELDDIDEMLMELDPEDGQAPEPDAGAHKQLEMFGALLDTLRAKDSSAHQVVAQDGRAYMGSWEEIVTGLRDAEGDAATPTLEEYMRRAAVRARTQLGVDLPSHDAESFLRASANAGLLRILR